MGYIIKIYGFVNSFTILRFVIFFTIWHPGLDLGKLQHFNV